MIKILTSGFTNGFTTAFGTLIKQYITPGMKFVFDYSCKDLLFLIFSNEDLSIILKPMVI
ncbi:MAG: hypothetical protein QM644_18990 [Mobilitalea sp.]